MDVLMVIAAWGERVGLLVSPSPSSDRSSFAKTRIKNHWLGPWTCPICRARSRPPPHPKDVKYDRNIEANL